MGRALVGAETNMIYYYYSDTSMPFAAPYSIDTGKRQFCAKYMCPDYRYLGWFRFSPHDNYFIDEIVFA